MKTTILLLVIYSVIGVELSGQKKTCELVIKVNNIQKIEGNLKFAVFDKKDSFLKKAAISADIKIIKKSMEYTFDGLSEGFYAVSIFHDENLNGELDANFMGIPSEPYGFSNNAKGMFGPPDFEDCKFEISAKKEIVINL